MDEGEVDEVEAGDEEAHVEDKVLVVLRLGEPLQHPLLVLDQLLLLLHLLPVPVHGLLQPGLCVHKVLLELLGLEPLLLHLAVQVVDRLLQVHDRVVLEPHLLLQL